MIWIYDLRILYNGPTLASLQKEGYLDNLDDVDSFIKNETLKIKEIVEFLFEHNKTR